MRHLALATILAVTPLPAGAATSTDGSCYAHVRSDAQFRLVARESRGNPTARNPRSTAFGCLQLLRGNRARIGRVLGIHPDTTNPAEQMRMGSHYIDARYGSDERALAHSLARGWF